MGTRVYDLLDAIETKLTAATWTGDAPEITVGEPLQAKREHVILATFGEVSEQQFAYIGQGTREEIARLVARVGAFHPKTSAGARARLQDLTDVVEATLKRPDPINLGVTGVMWVAIGAVQLNFLQTQEGWTAEAVIPISALCHI